MGDRQQSAGHGATGSGGDSNRGAAARRPRRARNRRGGRGRGGAANNSGAPGGGSGSAPENSRPVNPEASQAAAGRRENITPTLSDAFAGISLSDDKTKKGSATPPDSKALQPIRRPDRGGTDGDFIKLVSNHMEINIKGKLLVYSYLLEFIALRDDGRPANRRLNR